MNRRTLLQLAAGALMARVAPAANAETAASSQHTFIPTGPFAPSDFAEIENEFSKSAALINYDRENSKLFPSNQEAAVFKERGIKIGEYHEENGIRTVVGYPPSDPDAMGTRICKDDHFNKIDSNLNRLYLGLHEASHFFAETIFTEKALSLYGNTRAKLPQNIFETRDGDPRDPVKLLTTYLGENIADISASIYLLNKYPQDPAIKPFLKNWLKARATRYGVPKDGYDYYHNSSALMERLLEVVDANGHSTIRLGQNIDLRDTTKAAFNFIGQNLDLAANDFKSIYALHDRHVRLGALTDKDIIATKEMTPNQLDAANAQYQRTDKLRSDYCGPK